MSACLKAALSRALRYRKGSKSRAPLAVVSQFHDCHMDIIKSISAELADIVNTRNCLNCFWYLWFTFLVG